MKTVEVPLKLPQITFTGCLKSNSIQTMRSSLNWCVDGKEGSVRQTPAFRSRRHAQCGRTQAPPPLHGQRAWLLPNFSRADNEAIQGRAESLRISDIGGRRCQVATASRARCLRSLNRRRLGPKVFLGPPVAAHYQPGE